MSILRWDPWSEMLSLRETMDRLLEESFGRPGAPTTPGMGRVPLDVRETADEYVIEAAVPGVRPEDVQIQAMGNTLTISGEVKEAPEERRQGQWLVRERRTGRFARTVTLPGPVAADRAEATFEHGVLTVHLPKAEEAKAKAIPIRTGAGTAGGVIEAQSRTQPGTTTTQATQPAPSAAAQRPAVDMDVVGSDGEEVGRVKEVHANDFVVDRRLKRDVTIPFNGISAIQGNRVVLTVPADEVDTHYWGTWQVG